MFIENHASVNQNTVKRLLQSQNGYYGIKAAEDEIIATSAIESIDFSRDSVRNILKGMAPNDEQENRILGIKKGLEFIADTSNKINEENLFKLYMMSAGDFVSEDDKLLEGNLYRHDTVYVVGEDVAHSGVDFRKVPELMKALIDFINAEDVFCVHCGKKLPDNKESSDTKVCPKCKTPIGENDLFCSNCGKAL